MYDATVPHHQRLEIEHDFDKTKRYAIGIPENGCSWKDGKPLGVPRQAYLELNGDSLLTPDNPLNDLVFLLARKIEELQNALNEADTEYAEGNRARVAGKPADANPYKEGSPEHHLWHEGWSALDHLRAWSEGTTND